MRLTLLTFVMMCLSAPAVAQDLRSAFYGLPKENRIAVQQSLAANNLYHGVIDGLWGPGTAHAVEAARHSLAWPGFAQTAHAAGLTKPGEALWAYILDPDMSASLVTRR